MRIKELTRNGLDLQMIKGLKRELGCIGVVRICDYFQVQYFRVHEKTRNKGIGKKLIDAIVERAKNTGVTEIVVYPNSEPYDEEGNIENKNLYEIYQKLGFEFVEENVDINEPNKKMIRHIEI